MFNRLRHLLRKEFIQVFRDKRLRVYIFLPPMIQLIIFGYAANLDVHHIKTAVLDQARSPDSRALIQTFQRSGYFDLTAYLSRPDDLHSLFDRGRITLAVSIPAEFSARLNSGRSVPVQIILDGTDSQAAQVAASYATRLILRFGQEKLHHRLAVMKGFLERDTGQKIERLMRGVEVASRVWYNPNLTSRNFFVPGIVALILTIMILSLTSMSIVREREMGTLEQLLVTPITPGEFILGKTIPFGLIGLAQVSLVLLVGVLWFKVPFAGSVIFFYLASSLYLITSLGLGLLISTVSRTQQQAMTTTFLFLFPAILFSGFMFPIANMPRLIQWITYLNPLRYFITIMRDIFLKGSPWFELAFPLAALGLMGPLILILAASRVRKGLG